MDLVDGRNVGSLGPLARLEGDGGALAAQLFDAYLDQILVAAVMAGLGEKELMRGIQKLANRLTTGLIIAALIVGAALLMRIDTKSKLVGYPSVAIVCFLAAALAGVWLILYNVTHDLPQRRRHKTRP